MADADIPPDVTPPTITQTWDTFGGPPLDGQLDLPSGPRFGHAVPPRGPKEPPTVRNYVVAPGDLEHANSEMLSRTQPLTESYNNLKDYITTRKSWIFSVPNDHTIGSWYGWGELGDPHPDWTRDFSSISDNLLLQVADAVETTGQYIRALNTAAQFYTKADMDSDLPTLPVRMEPRTSSMEDQTPH